MEERSGVVTFKGEPMTVLGAELKEGAQAPDFTVLGMDYKPVQLSDFKGQVVIVSVVPSLDTGICEIQTKKFNEEASKLSGVKTLTASVDLPFAQKRFCAAHHIENLQVVTDFRDHSLANAWGLMIKELGLLMRAVFVIDKAGKVVYRQLVKEVATEPDYAPALEAARKAAAA